MQGTISTYISGQFTTSNSTNENGDPVFPAIENLCSSNLNTVVIWAIHIDYYENSNNPSDVGDIYIRLNSEHGDQTSYIVGYDASTNTSQSQINSNSQIGIQYLSSNINSLKNTSGTQIKSVFLSMGGYDNTDFTSVQKILNATGGQSALKSLFSELKSTLPGVDGIDFDNEEKNDVVTMAPSMIELGTIIYESGFQNVTMCPYMPEPDPTQKSSLILNLWIATVVGLNALYANFVSGINLQCYAGGQTNTPSNWANSFNEALAAAAKSAGDNWPSATTIPVYPGLAFCGTNADCNQDNNKPCSCTFNTTSYFTSTLQSFSASCTTITGGFLWCYDDVIQCGTSSNAKSQLGEAVTPSDYITAIYNAFNSTTSL